MERKRVLILGAAGRDFHNFNTIFRNNPAYEVVGFTATQIPNIEGRTYPYPLSGDLYKNGIPIYQESELANLIKEHKIDECVFSYSDVSHNYLMERASIALTAGADFKLIAAESTMLQSKKPVISITAIRTGAGKSPTTRGIVKYLKEKGLKVVVVRHPMPYGDLLKQEVQRFETYEDMKKHNCTIEEMEEYEHYIAMGIVVYAGVDYEKILRQAEEEADIVIWDGGNNDTPFYKPDLDIVVLDPLRAGHEVTYYPGFLNLIRGGVLIINKVDQATSEQIAAVYENIKKFNKSAVVLEAESEISVDNPNLIEGKRVLIVEDGPTLTHGEMNIGAGFVAAKKYGAKEIVEPEKFATGSIKEAYKKYAQLKNVLPALGYFPEQLKELEETINRSDAEVVIIGTPINLKNIIKIDKPTVRVTYSTKVVKGGSLNEILDKFIESVNIQ